MTSTQKVINLIKDLFQLAAILVFSFVVFYICFVSAKSVYNSIPPIQEAETRGFCVDNDTSLEQYQFVYEKVSPMFSECNLIRVRQDMISCLGDDYFQYECN